MNRGNLDVQTERVSLGETVAVYSLAELDLVRGLPIQEAEIVHELKAMFGGELTTVEDHLEQLEGPVQASETTKGPVPAPLKKRGRNEPLPGQSEIAIAAV